MLDCFPIAFGIGTLLGFLSGIGVGGGTLLVLWLTLVLGIDQQSARIINLLFFIPSALIVSICRWKEGKLNIPTILPAIIAGCFAAWLFSQIGKNLDTTLFKRLFGPLLLITGVRELLYNPNTHNQRPRNAR